MSELVTRRVSARPAYKQRANKWRLAAAAFFTAWLFTAGALRYFVYGVEVVRVIAPSAE